MKKTFLFLLVLCFTVVAGCSKKEGEIKIVKQEDTLQKVKQPESQTQSQGKEEQREEKENSGEQGQKTSQGKIESKVITTAELKSSVGKKVIVKAYIADVVVREKVAYLNFDKKYPNNTGSVTIFAGDFDKFSDLEKYRNKKIEVSGTVSEYKNKPQVIIKSENQIKISN
jgi:DNA/RNA endonuclease YhcR with UshA esterase domain